MAPAMQYKGPLNKLLAYTNDEENTLLVFNELIIKDIYSFLIASQRPKGIDLNEVILSDWGRLSSPYSVYYGTIAASAIGEWYKKYGNSLFDKNIRFYKGNTEVNEGMKQVLLKDPENFFYYNNGIKLLCASVERKAKYCTTNKSGLFALSNVSLVNGAQTTGAIGNAYLQNAEQVSKASVMIQIIDLSNAEENTASLITKLSNTQNRIDSRDFVSLDPEQERLKTEMAFSHIAYIYKGGDNGDGSPDPENQISINEAIIAMACWNDDISYATLAKRNVGGLSDDITKGPYKVLFNSGTNSYVLINNVRIIRRVEAYLKPEFSSQTQRS